MTESAESDCMEAQYHLGCWYQKGDGVEKDLIAAVYWYARAAAQRHTEAEAMLDNMDEKNIIKFFDANEA